METSISEYLIMHSTVLLMGFQNVNIVKSISKEYNAVRFGVAFCRFFYCQVFAVGISTWDRETDRRTDGRTLYRYIDPAASSVNNAVHCCLISLTSVHNAHYMLS